MVEWFGCKEGREEAGSATASIFAMVRCCLGQKTSKYTSRQSTASTYLDLYQPPFLKQIPHVRTAYILTTVLCSNDASFDDEGLGNVRRCR